MLISVKKRPLGQVTLVADANDGVRLVALKEGYVG